MKQAADMLGFFGSFFFMVVSGSTLIKEETTLGDIRLMLTFGFAALFFAILGARLEAKGK